MGLSIIIPVIVIAIIVPFGFMWAKKTLKESEHGTDDAIAASSLRLTSNTLRELPAPPWRVVYEIADVKLGGVEHVLIGPPGVYALQTSMEPLPPPPDAPADAHEIGASAIARGGLDDALRRCALSSDWLVHVHWGPDGHAADGAIELGPGHLAVDGRSLIAWATSLEPNELTPAQVDLAWQTVTTEIGRPDPLT